MPKRILVVDDDRNIGQILHASFSSKGYETIVSRNGEDALAKFGEVRPELVLLDVLLPKMNGWEVCRALKDTEDGKRTPIILMSAVYKNYKMQQDAKLKYGADDFLEKPFQLSRLLDKVTSLLGPGDEIPVAPEAAAPEAAGEVKRPQISLEGELNQTMSFAELLHTVYVMGKSGYLLVRRQDAEKEIAVKDGYPVSVRTTMEDEYFGNFLVRKRRITSEQRDESVERMRKSNRLQGTILIEMGVLTPHELVKFLRLQMRGKIFDVFSWTDGLYKFTENDEVQGDITTLDMSTANVINEGVRDHYNLDRLLPLIDEWRDKYVRPGINLHYRFQDIELTPRESTILQDINGTRTIDEVLGMVDLETTRAYQIVYTLVTCEMVELIDKALDLAEPILELGAAPPAPTAPPVEPPAKAPPPAKETAAPPPEPKAEPKPEPAAAAAEPPAAEAAAPPAEEKDAEAKLTEDDDELRRRISTVYDRVSQGNYFRVLDVNDNPTEHEVRVAYYRMAKEYHPDRFFGKASPDVKAKVEEIFRQAAKAYDILNTQEKILQYRNKVETRDDAPKTDARIEGVKKIIVAEQHFQNGKQYLKEKRYARAAGEFRSATEISTSEAEYVAYYGWALYHIPYEKDISEEDKKLFAGESTADLQFNGREAINRAIQYNPRSERAYLFLGAIYKKQGLKEFAEKQYEKALICNPNCIEALRELRLIKLEEQKKEKKKSFFDRLLGR